MKRLLFAAALFATQPGGGHADTHPGEVAENLPQSIRLGAADVRYWGFNLYAAELWATDRTPLDFDGAFALTLTYKRHFTARELSGASVKEVARLAGGDVADHAVLASMLEACFADVAENDRITGISETRDKAAFYVNGRRSCAVDYPDFSRLFFGIWLGDGARDAKTRDRLLGRAQ